MGGDSSTIVGSTIVGGRGHWGGGGVCCGCGERTRARGGHEVAFAGASCAGLDSQRDLLLSRLRRSDVALRRVDLPWLDLSLLLLLVGRRELELEDDDAADGDRRRVRGLRFASSRSQRSLRREVAAPLPELSCSICASPAGSAGEVGEGVGVGDLWRS